MHHITNYKVTAKLPKNTLPDLYYISSNNDGNKPSFVYSDENRDKSKVDYSEVKLATVKHISVSIHQGRYGLGIHTVKGIYSTLRTRGGPPSLLVSSDGYLSRKDVTLIEEIEKRTPRMIEPLEYRDMLIPLESKTYEEAWVDAMIITLEQEEKDIEIVYQSKFVDKIISSEEKFKKISNKSMPDYIDKITHLYDLLRDSTTSVRLKSINDYKGYAGIDRALFLGALATNMGRTMDRVDYNVTEYWKGHVVRNPLLAFKHMMFITTHHDMGGIYRCYETGNDIYNLGKRSSKTGYSVVIPKEECSILKELKNTVIESSSESTVISIELDKVYHKTMSSMLRRYSSDVLYKPNPLVPNYNFLHSDVNIIKTLNPVNTSLIGINLTDRLVDILIKFKEGKLEELPYTKVRTLDVTDYIFIKNPKSGKMIANKENLDKENSCVTMPHPIKEGKVHKYNYGSSLPARNFLVNMVSDNVSVNVVSWEESEGERIRFAVIVFSEDFGYGIYSNLFTDLLL